MKSNYCFFVFLLTVGTAFAQGEELGPMMTNPYLDGTPKSSEATPGTFDSTFHYESDVVTLPFFDDFSKNKFQDYEADFSDPNVTPQTFYKYLEVGTNQELEPDSVFSTVQTFLREYNPGDGSITETPLPSATYDFSDLSSYPPIYETREFFPAFNLIDTLNDGKDPVKQMLTENIIPQDSATIFIVAIDDQTKLWLDTRVYHNYHFAKDPWTLGVATFDGLDESGYPYSFGSFQPDLADVLTSKPIDLTGSNPGDSIYLSFLVQNQGLGDAPENGLDSFYLEVYNPLTQSWEFAWSTQGGPVSDFKIGHIAIKNPDYFTGNFQFRFKNVGAINGGLDHFHLDYVNLRGPSNVGDTLFKDFALVYPVQSLLKTYQSVPWDHYKNSADNHMSDEVEVVIRNGSNVAENNSQPGSVRVDYAGTNEGTFPLPGSVMSNGQNNYGPRTTYYSYHDFSGGYQFDKTKTGTKQIFTVNAEASAQFADLHRGNDSSTYEQFFSNYYAYDDGTAEAAYGPTGEQARLAVRFEPYEADSLIGANIHFVPSVNDVSNSLFLLTVWEDNGGIPGNVLYEDDLFFPKQPVYESARDKFFRYYFTDTAKVAVSGSFFIGWRQFDAPRLNVGFDRNNDHSDQMYYSVDGGTSWVPTAFEGVAMIRPVFSTALDAELGIGEEAIGTIEEITVTAFPNPTSDRLKVKLSNDAPIEKVEVLNLSGQVLQTYFTQEISLANFSNGMYFLRVNESTKLTRIVKQ